MNREKETLRTAGLAVGYRQRRHRRVVVDDINITLPAGTLVCLLGPNGAGKSTLLRTLSGLLPKLDGEIWLDGMPLDAYSPRALARRLSIVLTDRVDAGALTGYTLVSLGRYPYTAWNGQLAQSDHAAIADALAAVGAASLAHRPVSELSDGERQKILIARALAQDPELMLLDEPTAYLDLPHRVEVMRILQRLAHTQNRTVLLSTHDLDLALRHADLIWLLQPGGPLAVGTPEDLVLSGAFAQTFARSGLTFDAQVGIFRTDRPVVGQVDPVGEGVAAIWTARALERTGYSVHTGANGAATRVEVLAHDQSAQWRITTGGAQRKADSVDELLATLSETHRRDKRFSSSSRRFHGA